MGSYELYLDIPRNNFLPPKRMRKKILHLTLKRKWFDLIARGIKKEEYREGKPYWEKKFTVKNFPYYKQYDEIHFRNGYLKSSPFMRVKAGLIYKANVDFDSKLRYMFVIKLGKILEIKNWDGGKK